MKPQLRIILSVLICISFVSSSVGGTLNLSKPSGIGFLLVGARQDASQIGGSGFGLGGEVFLRYDFTDQIFFSLNTGLYSVTDDIVKMENYKSVFLPAVELTAGYRFLKTEWFRPFVYSGLQFYGAVTKTIDPTGDVFKSHHYYGSLLAGFGIEFQVKPDANLVYLSWDYRNALLSSVNPSPEYWVMKAGVTFQLGRQENYRREMNIPYEEDLFSSLGKPEESGIGNISLNELEFVNSKIESLEKEILETKETVKNVESKINDAGKKMIDSPQETEIKPVSHEEASNILLGLSREEAYKKGLQEFMKNNYLNALSLFQALLEVYPEYSLASNCQYWIGESYYAIGQYQDAIQSFNHVFKYQKSYKYDDALIMLGQSYLNLDQNELAFSSFRELMDRYPESEYIGRAKQYINNL